MPNDAAEDHEFFSHTAAALTVPDGLKRACPGARLTLAEV